MNARADSNGEPDALEAALAACRPRALPAAVTDGLAVRVAHARAAAARRRFVLRFGVPVAAAAALGLLLLSARRPPASPGAPAAPAMAAGQGGAEAPCVASVELWENEAVLSADEAGTWVSSRGAPYRVIRFLALDRVVVRDEDDRAVVEALRPDERILLVSLETM